MWYLEPWHRGDCAMDYDDDKPTKYRKFRPNQPEGWVWKETGAKGPSWYPPIVEHEVDEEAEHLALCPVDESRAPGDPVALAAPGEGDALFVQFLLRSPEVLEAVERLWDHSFQDVGEIPIFELAYEFAGSTANKDYLNPMWVYREGK